MANDLWVYAEHDADGLTDLTLQCLARGRELADELGTQLSAVVVGSQVGELTESLAAHGAQTVLVAEDARLEHYSPSAHGKVVASAVQSHSPSAVLFPASTQGNDLAPGVAQAVGAGCVLDCAQISGSDGGLIGKRLEYDRNVLTSYRIRTPVRILTAQDGIGEPGEPQSGQSAESVSLEVVLDEVDLAGKVLSRDVAAKTVDLKEARIIVSAGAGVGSKENFALVEELASVLGGEVGATRAAVDAGWTTLDRQIGQTGETVRPDLYVACGISGAVQHRVGMMDSKCIVSVNSDASAPIFRFSHYCVVGDLVEVIPKLIALWQS